MGETPPSVQQALQWFHGAIRQSRAGCNLPVVRTEEPGGLRRPREACPLRPVQGRAGRTFFASRRRYRRRVRRVGDELGVASGGGFLGAVVRPLPDGGARTEEGGSPQQGTLSGGEGRYRGARRCRGAFLHPVDSNDGGICGGPGSRKNHGRTPGSRYRGFRRPGAARRVSWRAHAGRRSAVVAALSAADPSPGDGPDATP
jgi:hypothetical protein